MLTTEVHPEVAPARTAAGDHLSDASVCAFVTRRAGRAQRGMTEQGYVMRLRCLGGFGMLLAFVFFYLAMEEYALVSPNPTMKECVPCSQALASIINPEWDEDCQVWVALSSGVFAVRREVCHSSTGRPKQRRSEHLHQRAGRSSTEGRATHPSPRSSI